MSTPYEIIYQYCQDDIKRPDLVAEIGRRIQRAIQRYHRLYDFKKDHVDQIYVFEQQNTLAQQSSVLGSDVLYMQNFNALNLWIQQINTDLLTRPRKFSYIRKWQTTNPWGLSIIDPSTGMIGTTAAGDLSEANPDSLTDAYGYNRTDVYYRSGNKININSGTPLSYVYLGYFSDPDVSQVEAIRDWISVEYPALIAADVAHTTLGAIGREGEAKSQTEILKGEIATLLENNVRIGTR